MDGLAKFRLHRKDATSLALVRLFPLIVVDALGLDKQLLDRVASVRLLSNHGPRAEEDTIERHRLHAVLEGPLSSNIRPNAFSITETGTSNERDIRLRSNRAIRRDDGLMEIFIRVMSTRTTTRPLQDDRIIGVVFVAIATT